MSPGTGSHRRMSILPPEVEICPVREAVLLLRSTCHILVCNSVTAKRTFFPLEDDRLISLQKRMYVIINELFHCRYKNREW